MQRKKIHTFSTKKRKKRCSPLDKNSYQRDHPNFFLSFQSLFFFMTTSFENIFLLHFSHCFFFKFTFLLFLPTISLFFTLYFFLCLFQIFFLIHSDFSLLPFLYHSTYSKYICIIFQLFLSFSLTISLFSYLIFILSRYLLRTFSISLCLPPLPLQYNMQLEFFPVGIHYFLVNVCVRPTDSLLASANTFARLPL